MIREEGRKGHKKEEAADNLEDASFFTSQI